VLARRKEENMMHKYRCPHCGRYIGDLACSAEPDDEGP
jgi:hypothetical protein